MSSPLYRKFKLNAAAIRIPYVNCILIKVVDKHNLRETREKIIINGCAFIHNRGVHANQYKMK